MSGNAAKEGERSKNANSPSKHPNRHFSGSLAGAGGSNYVNEGSVQCSGLSLPAGTISQLEGLSVKCDHDASLCYYTVFDKSTVPQVNCRQFGLMRVIKNQMLQATNVRSIKCLHEHLDKDDVTFG